MRYTSGSRKRQSRLAVTQTTVWGHATPLADAVGTPGRTGCLPGDGGTRVPVGAAGADHGNPAGFPSRPQGTRPQTGNASYTSLATPAPLPAALIQEAAVGYLTSP
jgi:hypothetical protein